MIVFTQHALVRMKQRNISKSEVLHALEKSTSAKRDSYGHYIAQERLNGKIIRVVYDVREGKKFIITAYKTSKLKYL